MPDSIIPRIMVKRLEQAKDPDHEGVQICAELLQEIAEMLGVSGANLYTFVIRLLPDSAGFVCMQSL